MKIDDVSFNAPVIGVIFCPDIIKFEAAVAKINVLVSTFFHQTPYKREEPKSYIFGGNLSCSFIV
eukprot:15328287-Ditylum_brightwellii.AAC.1